ncbi:MAG: helix-turn-helix domain-containing protein [Candidatus Limiplasma sp.]|nr:helix-turn-helix domain-containing protein [Candidatus Limiplasma sp.]
MNPKRNARAEIVTSAWKLFYEQGYAQTTVEDIIRASGTSKGTFYHYFSGKDALLGTLSQLFDDQYTRLAATLPPEQDSFDTLMALNRELFTMVENSISLDLLTRLYSTQLVTEGPKHLLDQNRVYFRLLRQIVLRGQERGELNRSLPAAEIVKAYALCERALLYDWCLLGGEYSLSAYSARMMPRFLQFIREKQKENRIVAPIS